MLEYWYIERGLLSQARTNALSLSKRAHVDWNWPISREKYLKVDWSVKMPLYLLIMGVAGS